ncbi:hypothetical protein KUTeg_003344 [Tegillarca granosa]|uniref:Uncharacterized protein n=1 Tax=Tegillarca granosa TaxID=220873 RepID=A0ABQ9FRE6_TEGGR|nr:hypothetical protein KUTeg_003344 [Tegillarca granosa]
MTIKLKFSPQYYQRKFNRRQESTQIFSQTRQLIKNNTTHFNETECCLYVDCTDQKRKLRETITNTIDKNQKKAISGHSIAYPRCNERDMVVDLSCNKISLHRYTDNVGYVTEFGNWTVKNRLKINIDDDDDRLPVLRVVTLPENPFVVKVNTSNGTVYTGLMFEALEYLSEHAGFRYSTKECKDGEYGAYNETSKTWSGCIADVVAGNSLVVVLMLKLGTADLIVGPLTATSERQTAVDFPVPYIGYSGLQMLKLKTKKVVFFFGDVLSVQIWSCIIGTVIITGILVTFYEKFRQPKETEITDLTEGFWFSISAIVYAGSGKTPCRISSRLIIAGYWFSCALIMSAFTANMAAFLTISRLDDRFDSIEKVAENYAINITVVKGTATMSYFKHMSTIEQDFADIWERLNILDDPRVLKMPVWDYPLGEKYIVIWKRMLGTGLMPSSSVAIEAVRKNKIVLVIDSAFVKNYVERNCDLEAPAKPFSSRPYGYALRKRSKYLDKFSKL